MRPGRMNLPLASMRVASGGTGVEADGPTAAMRLSVTTTVASGNGCPPLPSITVAPTSASVPVCISSSRHSGHARHAVVRRRAEPRHHLAGKQIDAMKHVGERQVAEGIAPDQIVGAGRGHVLF